MLKLKTSLEPPSSDVFDLLDSDPTTVTSPVIVGDLVVTVSHSVYGSFSLTLATGGSFQ